MKGMPVGLMERRKESLWDLSRRAGMRRKMASIGTDRSPRRPDPVKRTITEGVIPDLELTERPPPHLSVTLVCSTQCCLGNERKRVEAGVEG